MVLIETLDEYEGRIHQRVFSYYDHGRIHQIKHLQGGVVHKVITKYYDEERLLVEEKEESINRITGEKNALSITQFSYHTNGNLANETHALWDMDSAKQTYQLVEEFDQNGCLISSTEWDMPNGQEEVMSFQYQ